MDQATGPNRRAIAAHELQEGDLLLGDWVSPERFEQGLAVEAVNHDLANLVLVVATGREIEFNADETVYIRRSA